MKKIRFSCLGPAVRFAAAILVSLMLAGCAPTLSDSPEVFQIEEGVAPYNHLNFKNNPDNFQFAIVSDREGGGRLGVFDAALERLNLLQPEFVMSVGDLIPGYTNDEAQLEAQWNEVDSKIDTLEMPFFYVVGNHDMSFQIMRDVWQQRRGGRDYYHFVYKDVLFLVINTEDPPTAPSRALQESYAEFKTLMRDDPVKAKTLLPTYRKEWGKMIPPKISDAQVDYIKQVLDANKQVRWTFCFMHKPIWDEEEVKEPNFDRIEALLADRPYTVFAGHQHNYKHVTRKGHDYIRLGSTGGAWHHEGAGNMDHITWVTMTEKGPIIGNLLLNGILDKNGAVEVSEFLEYRPDISLHDKTAAQ